MKRKILYPLKIPGVLAIVILMASVIQALEELPAQDLIWSSVDKPASPPNIILLLSDDQGWNGLSVSMHPSAFGARSSLIETPHLRKWPRVACDFPRHTLPLPSALPLESVSRPVVVLPLSGGPKQVPGYEPSKTIRWSGQQADAPSTVKRPPSRKS